MIKKLIKKILSIIKTVLPESGYQLFYTVNFGIYKAIKRLYYGRLLIYYILTNDRANLRKAKLIHTVMPYSLVGTGGLAQTYDIVNTLCKTKKNGSFIECGVAKGGSAALIALLAHRYGNNSKIWLFDSYEGLPQPTKEDYKKEEKITGEHIRPLDEGSCCGTYEEVEKLLFKKFKLQRKNIFMIKGWFEKTLPIQKGTIGSIALLRIDADWYQSVKCCLENLYNNVVSGGYIIIDDYTTCFGAKKALDEFLKKINIQPKLVLDGRGGCAFKKP